MSWRDAKAAKARQNGGWFCEKCGRPLTSRTAVGHHFPVYRRNGGKDVVSNCVIHCKQCEQSDHHGLTGNHKRGGRDVYGNRRPRHRAKGKGKRHYLPQLQGEGVNATFRKVPKNRPVHKLPETIQDSNSRTIEERLERIERVLFPCT